MYNRYILIIVYNVNNRKLKSLELEGDMKSTPLKRMVPKRCMPSLAQPKQTLSFPIPSWWHVGCQSAKSCRLLSNSIKIYVMRYIKNIHNLLLTGSSLFLVKSLHCYHEHIHEYLIYVCTYVTYTMNQKNINMQRTYSLNCKLTAWTVL